MIFFFSFFYKQISWPRNFFYSADDIIIIHINFLLLIPRWKKKRRQTFFEGQISILEKTVSIFGFFFFCFLRWKRKSTSGLGWIFCQKLVFSWIINENCCRTWIWHCSRENKKIFIVLFLFLFFFFGYIFYYVGGLQFLFYCHGKK